MGRILNYEFTKTVTHSTTEATAQKWHLKLTAGIIHYIEIKFPAGCAGLVHVRLLHGIHPVIPLNAEDDINGDNETIPFKEFYPISPGANILDLQAWNEDEVYDHSISVRIGVLTEEELNPWVVLKDLATVLKTLTGVE